MSKKNRSLKSKEVQAEQYIKISTSLFTAFLVTILILPITAILSAGINGPVELSVWEYARNLYDVSWYLTFLGILMALFFLIDLSKKLAYDIYDELYPNP